MSPRQGVHLLSSSPIAGCLCLLEEKAQFAELGVLFFIIINTYLFILKTFPCLSPCDQGCLYMYIEQFPIGSLLLVGDRTGVESYIVGRELLANMILRILT